MKKFSLFIWIAAFPIVQVSRKSIEEKSEQSFLPQTHSEKNFGASFQLNSAILDSSSRFTRSKQFYCFSLNLMEK